MVRRTYLRTRGGMRRRRIRGGFKIPSWLSKANSWLRKTGAISKTANFLSKTTPLPYVGAIGKVAGTLGYGRGGALKLSGMGVGLSGGRRRRVIIRRR